MKIFLTGATGFLGGELLVMLSKIPDVEKIYCLVRVKDNKAPDERIKKQFSFHGDFFDATKIIPVCGDLTEDNLTEQLIDNKELASVDTIIHAAANTYFSPIYIKNIYKVNVDGTRNLVRWANTLQNLETFLYVGTAWICGSERINRVVFEGESPNVNYKQVADYCRSKTAAEILVREAIQPEKLLVIRPSIIMGDSRKWSPRSYTILWAVAAFDKMRLLPMNPFASCDIVPVDYACQAIIELLSSGRRKYNTYHISSGEKSITSMGGLLEVVRTSGKPEFHFVEHELIKEMKLWSKKKLKEDSALSNYVQYLNYWKSEFGVNGNLRSLLSALDYYFQFNDLGLVFDNSRLLEDTNIGVSEPAHVYMNRNKGQIHEINVLEGEM